MVEFFDKDWVANKYEILKQYLMYQEELPRIDMRFYPYEQGIPVEYFPFIGSTYENPLVALQLDFNRPG